jgi:hypothetical protein
LIWLASSFGRKEIEKLVVIFEFPEHDLHFANPRIHFFEFSRQIDLINLYFIRLIGNIDDDYKNLFCS